MSNSKRALRSGIWYTFSTFLIKGIGFITTPVFTRLLSKTEFGLYNNYVSWLAIVTIVVTLNLESTLISARYDYEKDFDGYILSVLFLSTISTAIWFLIVNLFSSFFVSALGMDLIHINAMLFYLLFLPAIHLFQARERYYFEYKKTVALSLFIAIGTALLSVILVLYMPNKLTGRIAGSIIPIVLFGTLIYGYFIIKGKKIDAKHWKYALPICVPFIPHLLSLNMLNSMDRVMITRWCGPEDNAVYSLAYTCGSIVTLLMTSMNSAYAPWLGEKLNSGNHVEIRKFSKTYILSFFFLAVGIMAIAPEVLIILGGTAYSEAKYVMTPIAMGCVCQFLYTLFVNVEQFKKKTVGMAVASVTAALVNLILNSVFIPRIGYLAAAYTTLFGYITLLAIHMFLVYRLKLNDVYDYKLVILVIIVGIGVTALITFLYSLDVVRYAFIGTYCLALVYMFVNYKDRIVGLVKRL